MLKLIQLEIQKLKLLRYWKGVVSCNAAFLGLMIMIYFLDKMEGGIPFEDFDMAADMVRVLVSATFTIFASVLIIRLFIEEYRNKTMEVMFSYPIKRQKIMAAKLIIIFCFTFITVFVSTLFIDGLIFLTDAYFDIFPEASGIDDLAQTALSTFITALSTAGVSLVPLYFGLKRKSSPAVIVSAIILVSVLNSNIDNASLSYVTIIPVIIGLIGVFIAYHSIRNIEKLDVS